MRKILNFLNKVIIYLIVFFTGAAVLIIEITATRILAPYFGNTLFSVSSIIGIVLAALSLGYYLGGILADKYPHPFLFFSLILLSGVFSFFIEVFRKSILPLLGYSLGMKVGPPFVSCLLFFAPSLLLGMISPLAIKLKTKEVEEIGRVSGRIFFYSTIGSICGSFLTGFFLIPHFGTSKIIISTSFLLFIIGITGIFFSLTKKIAKENFLLLTILFIVVLAFSSQEGPYLPLSFYYHPSSSTVFQKDGFYQQIIIQDIPLAKIGDDIDEKLRILSLDGGLHSGIYLNSDELAFEYTKYYLIYQILLPNAEKALFLGGGGYTVPRQILLENNNIKKIDVVEIDPDLFSLAKKYFKLPEDPRLVNYINDARRFLIENPEKYDLIFCDTYLSLNTIPFHLTTVEFFHLLKEHLNQNGIVVINLIGNLKNEKYNFLLSEIKTIRSVFDNIYLFAVESPNSLEVQNFILLALNHSEKINFQDPSFLNHPHYIIQNLSSKLINLNDLDLESFPIFSDDFSPIEYFVAKQF